MLKLFQANARMTRNYSHKSPNEFDYGCRMLELNVGGYWVVRMFREWALDGAKFW